jgi:Protein of unknown function (DUF3313)
MRTSKLSVAAAFCLLALTAIAQTDEDLDADTSSTYDGLVQVKARGFRNVWVRPGVDPSVYSKILPGGAQFHYRDVRAVPNTAAARRSTTEFPIEQRNRATVEQIVVDAFREEAGKSEYFMVTDEPGPDTVYVWGGLYDVVSRVPPDYNGRSDVYLSSVGEATLVIQIEDSMTREVLARVIDRRAAEPAFPQRSNPVTNSSEVRRLASTWARIFRSSLDKWHDADLSSN